MMGMKTTATSFLRSASDSFISKFPGQISGILHGFDRLRLRGTLRYLYAHQVMEAYLNAQHILIKDFGKYVEKTSASVRAAAHAFAESWQRPARHLNSNQISKEQLAREIARKDGIQEGLIAVFSAIEPCKAFRVVGNRQTKEIELQLEPRKCLHFYFYFEHPRFGFMHVRLQSWFPFQIDLCLNGRHWLAKELDAKGCAYQKRENAILWCEDLALAQRCLDRQSRLNWPKQLDAFVRQVHPLHEEIRRPLDLRYYWTVSDSEYATDLLFKRPEDLARIYPSLVHHALRSFSSPDVMRFLGRKVPTSGHIDAHFKGEIISDLKRRPEGIRVKHSLDGNSIKLYDKQGSVLRVETTIPRSDEFIVYRKATGIPDSPKKWRRLRRSVADMPRRAEACGLSNARYLQALSSVMGTVPLASWTKEVCQPLVRQGRRHRALNPLGPKDAALFQAVNRGEFAINGFRNHEIRALLYPATPINAKVARKQSEATRRRIVLLRAHGLVRKVGKTRRYIVTAKGHATMTALLAALNADVQQLTKLAA
jgi:hypothetical protein